MATQYIYGASPSDVVTDQNGNVLARVPLEVYPNASTLRPVAGVEQKTPQGYKPVYRLTTDDSGRFQFRCTSGPTVWLKTADGGERWRIEAWQTTSEKLADLYNVSATATELPTGASPSVTVGGSEKGLRFGFGIPRGATGATGKQGPPGKQGQRGLQGPRGATGKQGPPGSASDDEIASLVNQVGSKTSTQLMQRGLPKKYYSKHAIDAVKNPATGDLALDNQTGWVWCWDGTVWKVWQTPPGVNIANQFITPANPWWRINNHDLIVRAGMAHYRANYQKATNTWFHEAWTADPIATIWAPIRPVVIFGAATLNDPTYYLTFNGKDRLQLTATKQGRVENGNRYEIAVQWSTL